MKSLVVYIHGAGGSAEEAVHYQGLFPGREVIGFDYRAETPWEAVAEFRVYFEKLMPECQSMILVANSIGAYYAMLACDSIRFEKVYFISPVVDMEKLITDGMEWSGVTEEELEEKGTIRTSAGQELSWEYLAWVREHPVNWNQPTEILYGGRDQLQSIDSMQAFAQRCGAEITVMEEGEHWFHTEEQMKFLDEWITKRRL